MDKENIKILELPRNAKRIGWSEFLEIGFVGDGYRSGDNARFATSDLSSSISGLRPPMYDEARSLLMQIPGKLELSLAGTPKISRRDAEPLFPG